MRNIALFLFTSCLIVLTTTAQAADRYVNADGICGGNLPCYTTLQAAIDASGAGDVIHVDAGVLSPAAKINVHTSVTILGPNSGVHPLPSQGSLRTPGSAGEAIIDGTASGLSGLMVITASDVIINGLEFRNGSGDLIDSESGTPTSSIEIKNCIIHDATGDEGIQLRNVDGALIHCNYIYDTAGDGINVCCGSVNAVIEFNELYDIASGDAAIYLYDQSNARVEGNKIHGTILNDGIKMGSKSGSDAGGIGGTVLRNIVTNTAQDGIAVYSSNTTVECNEITGSVSENGGIYVAFAVSNITLQHNNIHDNNFNTGKWGDPAGIMIGTAVNTASLILFENVLVNNLPNGMTNKAAGLVAATNQWWGAADGPSGAGAGSGDAVSTNITFSPWLAAAPSLPCPPIQVSCEGPVPVRNTTWGSLKKMW